MKTDILKLFSYDEEQGILIWKSHWHSGTSTKILGKPAGTLDRDGYLIIRVNNKAYKAHRIIWFLKNKTLPEKIDHINGNRLDNRIENLREANDRSNQQNRRSHREGQLLGASWNKFHNKWKSQIQINKKRKHLGYFSTELDAHRKYMETLRSLNE